MHLGKDTRVTSAMGDQQSGTGIVGWIFPMQKKYKFLMILKDYNCPPWLHPRHCLCRNLSIHLSKHT